MGQSWLTAVDEQKQPRIPHLGLKGKHIHITYPGSLRKQSSRYMHMTEDTKQSLELGVCTPLIPDTSKRVLPYPWGEAAEAARALCLGSGVDILSWGRQPSLPVFHVVHTISPITGFHLQVPSELPCGQRTALLFDFPPSLKQGLLSSSQKTFQILIRQMDFF